MKNRILSILLILSILATQIPTSVLATVPEQAEEQTRPTSTSNNDVQKPAPGFTDVQESQWFFDAIQYVYEKGIFSGVSDREFSPNGSMSRAMFVTVLGRLAGIDVELYRKNSAFSDVEGQAYYAPYVSWAASVGITSGMGNGKFAPEDLVTRAQMAKFIVNFYQAMEIELPEEVTDQTPKDLADIPDYAKDSVLLLWKIGFFKGDLNGNFNPTQYATRAEAAVLSQQLDTHIEEYEQEKLNSKEEEKEEQKAEDQKPRPEEEEELIEPYKIVFESNGGSPVPNQYLFEGRSLCNLPIPFRDNSVFMGWYYDEQLTKRVADDDTIYSDLYLYASFQDTTPLVETETPNFASALDQGQDFTITILAPVDMTASEVKAGIDAKNLNEVKQTDFITVTGQDGVFVLSGTNGFVPGSTYKIELVHAGLSFQGFDTSVRNFNFTTAKENVMNVQLNGDMYYIPFENLGAITVDDVVVSELVVPFVVLSGENANPNEMTKGTFEYNALLPVGAKLVVYQGVSPLERDLTTDNEGSVAYITITSVNGNVYSYESSNTEDVLFVPDVLPVPVDADLDGNQNNLSVTLPKYVLSFGEDIYANLDLDSQTTVDKGDYIAFYTGDFGENAQDSGYARISEVSEQSDQFILTYEMVTQEELLAVMDIYNSKGISGEKMLEGVDVQALEQSVELQAQQSGFVEEAAELLSTLALETNSFTKLREEYGLTDISMRTADGKEITPEELQLLGDKKVEVSVSQLKATLSTNLQHFSGLSGLRLTLKIGIEIEITLSDKAMIVIEIEGSFEEEVRIALNVSGGAQWKVWAIFPYIAEYNVTANVDLYNYTAIGIHASIVTKEKDDEDGWGEYTDFKDISEELKKLVDARDKYVGDGSETVAQSLNEKYAAMLEQESDWVELFSQELFKNEGNIDPLHILVYEISIEFVVSANMNISLGCDFWYENAKRYSYSVAIFANTVTSDTVDLVEEHYEFSFYVMGTMGLRAGIKAGISVGLFTTKLGSVGFTAEAGVYARVWGYFYYQLSYTASLGRSSSYAGALLFELGIYLEIAFEAQAFDGVFSYNPTLYENEWPLWSAGMRENVQNFAYEEDDVEELAMKKTIRTLSVPDELFEMAYLDLKTGDEETKIYDDAEHFTITITNPAFSYLPSSNILSVNPGNEKVQEGQMIITWITAPLAFTSAPISRTIDLYWDNYNDGYSISFNTNGGSSIPIFITRLNSKVTPPIAPQKQGYLFAGWFADQALTKPYVFPEVMPDLDIMIYAKWTPATDTKVIVEHYLQELNGSYLLLGGEIEQATTESYYSPSPKNFPGFVAPPVQGVTIKPDGSSILRYYYTRAIYTVTFSPGAAAAETVVTKLKYGAAINAPAMAASGYTFSKWNATLPSSMPASNLTFTALWTKNNDTPYRVEHYIKTTDQQRYALAELGLEYLTGLTDSTVDIAGLRRSVSGLTYRYATVSGVEVTSAVISGNGKLVIKLYYDRNPYQIHYLIENQQYLTQSYVYEETLFEPALPVKVGYVFDGWYTQADYAQEHRYNFGQSAMPANSFTLYGKWVALDQKYTLRHYVMTAEGSYHLAQVDLNQIAKTDETLILETLVRDDLLLEGGIRYGHGFVNQVQQTSVVIPATGSLLVELYYDRIQHSAIWQTEGGSSIEPVAYRYGQSIRTPQAPTKTGYLFAGWTWAGQSTPVKQLPSNLVMGITDIIFSASWNPATNTVYRVEHYFESLADGEYVLKTIDTKTGVTDSMVVADPMVMTGFTTYTSHSLAKPSGAVESQGTLVLRVYYSRNNYSVTWNLSGGVILSSENAYTHGNIFFETLIQAPQVEKMGYIFSEWQNYTNAMTIPAQDVVFTAIWTPSTNTAYKVEHYLQKLNTSDYEWSNSESLTGTTEALIIAVPKTVTGFTYKADEVGSISSGTILADGSLVLKLYYSRNNYIVSFNGNGTGSGATESVTVAYMGTVIAPAAPSRTGYTFTGWTKEATGETPWAFATDSVTQATTLYAQWQANIYEVRFDLNYLGAPVTEKINQTYDANYVLPTHPLRAGYVFEGWYDSISNGNQVNGANIVGITENQTLYAHWSEATNTPYTVKHLQQNVSGSEYTEVTADSQILTGVTNALTKATHKNYVGFTGLQITQTTIAADGNSAVSVYYNRNTYTLTFKPENGTGDLATEGVRYGTPITSPVAPSKVGYDFTGWGVGSNDTMPNQDQTYTATWTPATNTAYKVEHYLQKLNAADYELVYTDSLIGTTESPVIATTKTLAGFTYKANEVGSIPSGTIIADGSLVLNLYYSRNNYIVGFNGNGTGSGATESATVAYMGTVIAPAAPSRTGYTFTGWAKEVTGETPWTFATDTVTQATTLYAQWQANIYEVRFDFNYVGAPAAEKINQTYDANYEFPINPIRAGYAFAGWYTQTENGTEIDENTTFAITSTQTLYAYWSEGTNTQYQVHHYRQNVSGSDYTEVIADRQILTGVTNALTKATHKTYVGFAGLPITQTAIGAEGDTAVFVYYDRNTYTLTFKPENGTTDLVTEGVRYGTPICSPVASTKVGYDFAGWGVGVNDTMPDQNKTYTATWTPATNTVYKVEHYLQKLNAADYELGYTDSLTGTTEATVTATPKTIEGFTFKANEVGTVLSGTILAEGSLVLKLYYSRNAYTVNFNGNGTGSSATELATVAYLGTLTEPATPSRTGYSFTGWTREATGETPWAFATDTVTQDTNLYAQWQANTYEVRFDLSYVGAPTAEKINQTYNANYVLPTNPQRTGYTFEGWYDSISNGNQVSGASVVGITENQTLYASWSEAENTPYTVKHYQQNVSGTEYTEVGGDSQVLTGVTNAMTQAAHKNYVGFTGLQITQTTIAAEGNSVVSVYYNRNTYNLTFKPENGTDDLVTEGVRYGAPIISPIAPTKVGYDFAGWGVGVNDTMPDLNKTYTATWNAISYTVTFDFNYIGSPQSSQISQTYSEMYILPAQPNRTGYTFVGWFDAITGGNQIQGTTNVTATSTHTLYAHWQANNYTVNFNANYVGSHTSESIQQTYDQLYTIPSTNPSRTGYTFVGWFTAMTSGTQVDKNSKVLITTNQTLYAHWQVKQYTINYVLNNGQSPILRTYDYNSIISDAPQPTKVGYEFDGWLPALVSVVENATYEAQWSAISYDMTYNLTGGSMTDGSSNPVSYTIENLSFTLIAPIRTGYTFTGWTGTEVSTPTLSLVISMGSTGARSYTAHWTANTYSIVLNANGGQIAGGTLLTHTYDIQTILPDSGISKTGSTFEGWYEAEDLSGSQVSFIPATSLWSGDRTFYAKWTLIDYSLTYTSLYSTTHTNPGSYTYGQTINLTNPTERLGYTFNGWYVDGIKVISVNTLATKNLVLDAHWSVIPYSITYYLNDGTNNAANPSTYTVAAAVSLTNPTRTGYQFDAWYSDASLNSAYRITGTAIPVGSTGAKSFYATWVANTLTVKFNANLGSGAMTDQVLAYGTAQNLKANTFTRTAYAFAGWSMTSSGTKAYNDGGSILNPVTEGSVTLYAMWAPVTYSISYDLHGGSSSGGNPTTYNIESATISLASAIHGTSGYIFAGWFTEAAYTTPATGIPSGSYGNRTFHAKWVNYGVISVSNNGNNTFTISRSGGTDGAQTVHYRTLNGSAIGGTHFTHVQSTATIPAGQSSVTVTVTEQGITAMYGNYVATSYSNVNRVYSLEIFEVSGGAVLSSTTRAARTMSTNSSYTIDSGYLNNYRQIASSVKSSGGRSGQQIWENTAGYNGSVDMGLSAYALNNSSFPSAVQSYLQATASGMKVQLSSFKATDDGWGMHRYILFSNSTGSKYFSSDKNGAVPNLPSGTYYAMVHGTLSDNTDAYTIRSPGSLSVTGTSKTVTLYDQKWASGQDQGDYVLFGLNDIVSVTTSAYNSAAAISSFWFNSATLDAKPKDIKEPTYLGLAPMSHTSYALGSKVTVALVFDEIIGSISSGLTVTTNLSNTGFTYQGGIGTNVIYFEGTVTSTATSVSIVSINGNVYDLVN